MCQLAVGPVSARCRQESVQSGQRVERAREVVAGAGKDRPPVFVEEGREAGQFGFWGGLWGSWAAWEEEGGGGAGLEAFLTKRL